MSDYINLLQDHQFIIDLRQQMLKFAVVQLASLQTAEDVVQETLESAFIHIDSFKGKAAFKTWIFAILKNKTIDLIRKKSRMVCISELYGEAEEMSIDELFDQRGHWQAEHRPNRWESPEDMMENHDFWMIFHICLNHLPAKYAQVFILREMVELESDEICEKMGISISHLNVLMYRSRTKLRACLETGWLNEGNM